MKIFIFVLKETRPFNMPSTPTFSPVCSFIRSLFKKPFPVGCDGGHLTPIPIGEERIYCGIILPPVGSYGTECYRCEKCKYRVEIIPDSMEMISANGVKIEVDGLVCSLVREGQVSVQECLRRLDTDQENILDGFSAEYSEVYMSNGEPFETTFLC